jgi:hypothetical protein
LSISGSRSRLLRLLDLLFGLSRPILLLLMLLLTIRLIFLLLLLFDLLSLLSSSRLSWIVPLLGTTGRFLLEEACFLLLILIILVICGESSK